MSEVTRKPISQKGWNGFVRMESSFASQCICGNKIRKGKLFYWHKTHGARCYPCGPHADGKPEPPMDDSDLLEEFLRKVADDSPSQPF